MSKTTMAALSMIARLIGAGYSSGFDGPAKSHSRSPRPPRPKGADEADIEAAEARRERRRAKRLAEGTK